MKYIKPFMITEFKNLKENFDILEYLAERIVKFFNKNSEYNFKVDKLEKSIKIKLLFDEGVEQEMVLFVLKNVENIPEYFKIVPTTRELPIDVKYCVSYILEMLKIYKDGDMISIYKSDKILNQLNDKKFQKFKMWKNFKMI